MFSSTSNSCTDTAQARAATAQRCGAGDRARRTVILFLAGAAAWLTRGLHFVYSVVFYASSPAVLSSQTAAGSQLQS